MKPKFVRNFVMISVAIVMIGCASQNDKTEKSREDTTVTYFASKAKPVFVPVVVPVAKKEAVVQGIVYFDFDKHNIKPEFNQVLEDHARILRTNPLVIASVEGHTDVFGTNSYNQPLGLVRANEVRNALIRLGVQEQQLKPVSLSFYQPAVAGLDAESRALNRRAEIAYEDLR